MCHVPVRRAMCDVPVRRAMCDVPATRDERPFRDVPQGLQSR
jgi:hypothetical protein